jgi:hypothetical protein
LLVINGGCLCYSIAPSLLADSASGFIVGYGGFCLYYSIAPSLLADSASGSLVINGGFCLYYIAPFVVGGFCLWVHC